MKPSPRVVLALALPLVLVLFVLVPRFVGQSSEPKDCDPGSPLVDSSVVQQDSVFAAEPGEVHTYGLMRIKNTCAEPAVLQKVTLLGNLEDRPLQFSFEALVVPSGNGFSVAHESAFPPHRPPPNENSTFAPCIFEPLTGFKALPQGSEVKTTCEGNSPTPSATPRKSSASKEELSYSIVLKVTITGVGISGFTSAQLDYTVGQSHHKLIFPFGIKVCSPRSQYPTSCPIEPLPSDSPAGIADPQG